MDELRARLGLPPLGVAVGGVLAGHWLTYLIVRPDHHDRASLLASTGHGYLATATEVAMLVALVAAASAFLGRFVRGATGLGHRSLARRLGVFQVGAFVVLESAERAVSGSFDGLLVVCLAGAGVQLLVAIAAAWLLRRLEHAADVAASVLGRPAWTVGRPALAAVRPSPVTLGRGVPCTAAGIRGPPLFG